MKSVVWRHRIELERRQKKPIDQFDEIVDQFEFEKQAE